MTQSKIIPRTAYHKRLTEMSPERLADEVKKYFTGKAERCTEKVSSDCQLLNRDMERFHCKGTIRRSCLDCSFYKKKGYEEYAK